VREREHIETDAGADTKPTTKMRKTKNKRKILNILECPDER
jgi:hypothetical protein